jgi:hypothetical protein
MTSKSQLRNPTPEDRQRLLESADRLRATRRLEAELREQQAQIAASPASSTEDENGVQPAKLKANA